MESISSSETNKYDSYQNKEVQQAKLLLIVKGMFKVPVIPPDLRHEETIIQAAYALDCLKNVINTIFERIDNRIEKNNIKLKEIQNRISISQAKICSLQGTRNAIRIYAPARFPATTIFKDLPVTFDDGNAVKQPVKYQVQSKLDPNVHNFNEKLIFFHVRDQNSITLASENNLSKEWRNIKQNQYFCTIPTHLRSIQSLLLFNTDIRVFHLDEDDNETQTLSESWKRGKLSKIKRQYGNCQPVTAKQILEPAPHSLLYRRNEKLTPSVGLKYTPKLSEAPELDLPLDLPDLPGIADDLRYDSPEAKQKIAPSLAFAVEQLPELKELIKETEKNAQFSIEHSDNKHMAAPAPSSLNPIKESTAPQPPPPPPPPPPLLPPAMQRQIIPKISDTADKTNVNSASTLDSHTELMAAIRNAGGAAKARLRNTAASPLAVNNDDVDNSRSNNLNTKKDISSQGGDLMADLHNKLLMRRKGISGSKNDNNSNQIKNMVNTVPTGNTVISHLSALIPPPTNKQIARNAATTSEEENEDDSNDNDWVD